MVFHCQQNKKELLKDQYHLFHTFSSLCFFPSPHLFLPRSQVFYLFSATLLRKMSCLDSLQFYTFLLSGCYLHSTTQGGCDITGTL